MKKKDRLYEINVKKDIARKKNEVVCSCGWKNIVINRYNRTICKNCGNYVYLRKQDQFKNNLLKYMKGEK